MIDLKQLKLLAESLDVLYVEDDKDIQETVLGYIQKVFHSVVVANDGAEGLEFYKKQTFDIVITDLSMPRMDGLEMVRKIREINSEQAVLITTAYTDATHMNAAISIGIDGYIVKPFDYEQFNYELNKISKKLYKFKQNIEYQKHLEELVDVKTSALKDLMHTQECNYENTLLSMVNMIDQRDSYTAGHSQRVSDYCYRIAKEMGYSEEECTTVSKAGILHDIGKIATPDVVLLKPQSLNALEYALIKEHANVGYEVLKDIPMFHELALIVRDHHERCDGSGYPRGLKYKRIHPLALVMMVADTFDAMTTNRIYKGRKSVQEALAELKELSQTQYNAKVVDAALIVLKDVDIPSDINQLPHTDIEKERFAYFYKDNLTGLYNKNYLDVMLVQNEYDKKFSNLYYIQFKHFSEYNKKHGWSQGDIILKKFAAVLERTAGAVMAFTIFGDDFVLLDNGECDVSALKNKIERIIDATELDFSLKTIDLKEQIFTNADELEKL